VEGTLSRRTITSIGLEVYMGKTSRERMTELNSEQRIQRANAKVEEKQKKEHEARLKMLKILLDVRKGRQK